MSKLIEFLETLGRDDALPDPAAYMAAAAEFAPGVRAALLARDPAALALAVGGRARMACYVTAPGENDEPLPERAPDYMPDEPTDVPQEPEERAA